VTARRLASTGQRPRISKPSSGSPPKLTASMSGRDLAVVHGIYVSAVAQKHLHNVVGVNGGGKVQGRVVAVGAGFDGGAGGNEVFGHGGGAGVEQLVSAEPAGALGREGFHFRQVVGENGGVEGRRAAAPQWRHRRRGRTPEQSAARAQVRDMGSSRLMRFALDEHAKA